MSDIILHDNSLGGNIQQTIDGRDIHDELGITKDYTSWVKAQIKSLKLVEDVDYVVFTQKGENLRGGRPSRECFFPIDIAKHIALASRTEKGRIYRQKLIDLEKRSHQYELVEVSDPSLQMLMEQSRQMQAMIVRLDRAQIEAAQAKENAAQAQAMALQVMQAQQYLTIREFVMFNDLTRQCPPGTTQQQFGKYMTGFCREHGWPLRKMGTENAYTEWGYPAHLLQQNIFSFLARRNGQIEIDEDGIWHSDC